MTGEEKAKAPRGEIGKGEKSGEKEGKNRRQMVVEQN